MRELRLARTAYSREEYRTVPKWDIWQAVGRRRRRNRTLAEPDVAVQVAQHDAGMPVPDWARLLRCTECGVRDAAFVATGERR